MTGITHDRNHGFCLAGVFSVIKMNAWGHAAFTNQVISATHLSNLNGINSASRFFMR
jgi:hypothetical protein